MGVRRRSLVLSSENYDCLYDRSLWVMEREEERGCAADTERFITMTSHCSSYKSGATICGATICKIGLHCVKLFKTITLYRDCC